MKLIVGLGNPGSQYDRTRHNAGFVVLDRLAKRWPSVDGAVAKVKFQGLTLDTSVKGQRCLLLKPTTYMNLSGRSVGEAASFYKLDVAQDVLVVVDDVSLPTGTIRVRAGGSAGGHNGLTDIERALGTDQYPRLRVGVDACPKMMKLEDWVLGRFTEEQAALLGPAVEKACDAVETFVDKGLTAAMNTFNAAPTPPKAESDTKTKKTPNAVTSKDTVAPSATQKHKD